jgi:hypothetical protein
VISAVAAGGVSSSAATISWTTNEPADSQVDHGTTTAYGQTSALNTMRVTSRTMGLSGLSPGTLYHYRVKSRDAAGNLAVSAAKTFTTTATTTQSPYKGAAFPVPGLIQAEDFDKGGEGIAYHDKVTGNAGGLYRLSESVDIVAGGTGYVVNNIQTGEWLEYTIHVAQAGLYRIEASVSSAFATSRWRAEIDGANVTGSITVPSTGSWGTFRWVGKSGISLAAGTRVLRIYAEQEYFNLDAIRIVSDTIAWTNTVNVTATGSSLKKTTGCDGCQDAGATSQQQIASGNGYLQFSASETTTQRVIGLSRGNTDTSKDDIDFGLQLWPGGTVDVRENGAYRGAETSYATGDVFRVAVQAGVVKYSKNGVVFYTSAVAPSYPLLVDTAFLTLGASVANVTISAGP